MQQHEFSNPFAGFVDFAHELNRVWQRGSGVPETAQPTWNSHADAFTPHADVLAHGDDLIVRCAVPGAQAEDVHVTYAHSLLTVAGQTAAPDDQGCVYHTSELQHGRFRRSFTITANVRDEDITVRLEAGIVEITVPGVVTNTPRRLPVVDSSTH